MEGSGAGRAERVQRLLAVPAVRGPEELPAVADADPYGELGVSRSLYSHGARDPYVRRPWLDDALDNALRERDFVLLVGGSKAGKWRSAWEAVRRTLPEARLLVPRPGVAALAELLALDPPLRVGDGPGVVVVWLDGLEHYLSIQHGMDVKLLGRLRALARRVVVLAAIHSNVREHLLSAEGRLGQTARLVLEQATTIMVAAELTPQERVEAQRLYPNEDFQRGIGEQLVGASALERRYREGHLAGHGGGERARIGWAVVQAAVDWRRMGLHRPITEPELRELSGMYLPAGIWASGADARWAEGLCWALTEPPGASAALLEEVPGAPEPWSGAAPRAFLVPDFLVSCADALKVRPEAWQFALRRCDAFELMQIAVVAGQRRCSDTAELAWRQAIRSAEPLVASSAGLLLGGKLADRGDRAGAIAVYRQSIADGERVTSTFEPAEPTPDGEGRARLKDSSMAALACVNLGQLLAEEGETTEAIAVYRKGIALDDPAATPLAAMNLAGLLREQGDLAAARSAYEQALAAFAWHGDPNGMRGMVAHALGSILADQGEIASALAALKLAIDSGHRSAAPRAAARMGLLLNTQGDHDGAAEAFRIAAASEDPSSVEGARIHLAALRAENSDPEQAMALYRRLAAAEVPMISGPALVRLGGLLASYGDLTGAANAYQQAMEWEDENPVAAATSALHLGKVLLRQGDRAGARSAFQRASVGKDADVAPHAAFELADLLLSAGDLPGAEAAARAAVRSGHADVGPRAELLLGVLCTRRGDREGGRAAYERALASGHASAAPTAAFNLARLLEEQGDTNAARAAYRRVMESGHVEASASAAYSLGAMLRNQGDWNGARAAFQWAVDSGHPQLAPLSLIFLGDALMNLGNVDGGRSAFERAARSGNQEVVAGARERLQWLRRLLDGPDR